jgi:hypothetical protein
MPSLIKQGEAKILTKNGEVFVNIALELTIKLEGANALVASGDAGVKTMGAKTIADDQEKVTWEIPDFSPSKIDFGK